MSEVRIRLGSGKKILSNVLPSRSKPIYCFVNEFFVLTNGVAKIQEKE